MTRTEAEAVIFADLAAQRTRLGPALDAAMARVLDHGQFIMGPEVDRFEDKLAAFCGARHALTCANGTDALLLVLKARNVGPGDAVIVPTFTFAATAEVVALAGATPVFADVLPDTFNLDPDGIAPAVEAARRQGLRPVAVIPVDLFGQPADHDAIAAIAARHGLWILADAAQSCGARLGARRVGQFGTATAVSFFPAKPLGCYGDGGAVLTDDDELAETVRSLRFHGRGSHKYENVRVGLNSRLDTLQAAVLLEKLAIFPEEIMARNAAADRYQALLAGTPDVILPRVIAGARSVWAQYTLQVPAVRRDAVMAAMKAQGVPTMVYYPLPLHRQKAYADCPRGDGGVAVGERLATEVLSLPMHPYLTAEIQERVAVALQAALRG